MNKQFPETTFIKKAYSKPQMVVEIVRADVISTSNERYEEEDTDDWFNS